MPATTPTHQIPYPLPTDPIANGAALIAQLAARIDELEGERGTIVVTPDGSGATTSVNVGFSRTYSVAPDVQVVSLSVQNPGGAGWWINNRTASGFVFNIRRSSGPGTMSFAWNARAL